MEPLETQLLNLTPTPKSVTRRLTFAEYMEIERLSPVKHDFVGGEMIEVAGASTEHNTICGNVIGTLLLAAASVGCRVLTSDQKVYISNRIIYYPDVTIACGELLVAPGEALQNPVLICEVLSPSTAAKDRGSKFAHCRTINTLQHYVLIEQDEPSIEHWMRQSDGKWQLESEHKEIADTWLLRLNGVEIPVALADVYRFVTFPPPAPEESDEKPER